MQSQWEEEGDVKKSDLHFWMTKVATVCTSLEITENFNIS